MSVPTSSPIPAPELGIIPGFFSPGRSHFQKGILSWGSQEWDLIRGSQIWDQSLEIPRVEAELGYPRFGSRVRGSQIWEQIWETPREAGKEFILSFPNLRNGENQPVGTSKAWAEFGLAPIIEIFGIIGVLELFESAEIIGIGEIIGIIGVPGIAEITEIV